MDKITGVSIFEGIVISKAYMRKKKKEDIKLYRIQSEKVDDELMRFQEAVLETKQEIKSLIESLTGKVNQNDIKILNSHIMILEDPLFVSDITNKIRLEMINAEKIVESVVQKYVGMFRALNDPVFREKAIDIEDVGEKLIRNLQGIAGESEDINNKILIAKDIKPSDILKYHNEGLNIMGIVTETSGETSHVAILAKTMGIPTLIGAKNLSEFKFAEDEEIILDSRKGREVLVNAPSGHVREWYIKEKKEFDKEKEELLTLIDKPAFTKDGERVRLASNIGGVSEINDVVHYKTDGIGLLRTEFLYMESKYFPEEDEQFEAYKKIAEAVGNENYTVIRTLDIGADKKLSYFEMPDEENPALGMRAIRLCLNRKDIFKTQLRAILRASIYGNIQIMYPMISGIEELEEVNKVLDEAKEELDREKIEYNKEISVGIMIEVPAAAILAEELIKRCDFFSIGTNDLTQYVIAADRLGEGTSYLYDNFHPAVLRLISIVADAANKAGKKVSVCGEMGGDPTAALAFLSMGIRDLSMLSTLIPKIKKVIKEIDTSKLAPIKNKILQAKKSSEIKNILNDYLLAGVNLK